MTEAPAQAPLPPVAEPAPPPQGSLWADAFRRLLKNRLAVLGAIWLTIVGTLAALAPVVVPFDPQDQEWWAARRAPLFAHAKLRNQMWFERKAAPPAPFPESAKEIALELKEGHHRDVRIQISGDGRVTRIELAPDYDVEQPRGETPETWTLGPGERIVSVHGDGARAIDALSVALGKPAPSELGASGVERTFVGEWRKGERVVPFVATVEGGVVAKLMRDGKSVRAKAKIEADEVVSVRVDGAPWGEHRHLLGTDDSGRDILSRVIFGGRISLLVGIVATVVSLVIGVVYGAVSGYAGGKVDEVMMRIVDILYAIPFMFFVIILLVLFGNSLWLLFAAIGAVEWLTMARIVRGQVLSLKEKEFIEAARVAGTPPLGIVFGHLIPNSLGTVIVYTTLTIPEVILTEAFLSFLGLSVQYEGKALESWGSLTRSGMDLAQGGFPWLLLVSATVLSLTLFSLNFLGDGLRDALDPRQRGRA